MKRKVLTAILAIVILLLGGQLSSPIQSTSLQSELAQLAQREFTCRFLDNDVIELTDPVSGETQTKTLHEPTEATIRSWAAARGVPILEIDPAQIDTIQFAGWYNYWSEVPLGNSSGNPFPVGDANHNRLTDVYGVYQDTFSFDYEARIYEIDSLSNVFFRYKYVPRPGGSRQFADVDKDSLIEVLWNIGGVISGYEQHSRDSLPTYRAYEHSRYYHGSQSTEHRIYVGNLDGDSLTDLLYQGSGPSPNDTNIAIQKTYVAEYDPALQTFVRVWSIQFLPNSGAHGFSVGDFDNDGKMELVATHQSGKVYVAENSGDNQYATTWQDSVPFVNFYYQGSGDVDNDGKIEFFTGATMSDGNWVLMYEADSNNSYSAKLLFHLLSGGVFANPIYQAVDMDGDGKLELAMMVGSDLYIFKSNGDNEYYLWYFRRENGMEAIAFYDFNRDGRMDFICSKFGINSQGRGWFYSHAYVASALVSVKEQQLLPSGIHLLPNYPNPFNGTTRIRYSLPSNQSVNIRIYDIAGREVSVLVNEVQPAGEHETHWDPSNTSSGIYFYRLITPHGIQTKKMILLR